MAPRIREALKRYELREGEDVSWSELGRRVWRTLEESGDSAKWVSRVKLGQQEPSVAEGGAIAYLLDVSPLWLFWEIGTMDRFPSIVQTAAQIEALKPVETEKLPVAETQRRRIKTPRKTRRVSGE